MEQLQSITVSGTPFQIGHSIGATFKHLIRSRLQNDKALHTALLPFYASVQGRSLVELLCTSNKSRYPQYWEEMKGMARGSEVPFEQVLLLNLRKEIGPFLNSLPNSAADSEEMSLTLNEREQQKIVERVCAADQCSTVLLCSHKAALVAHNEDADAAVVGHAFLVCAALENGVQFTAFTYAGELPSCAFGFNNHGIAFTLNAVPPSTNEVVAGGIGRNFVSRDLLEAVSMDDALKRICLSNIAAGHNYNIMDAKARRIVTVETASKGRFSVLDIGEKPYFHANMYIRLSLDQRVNESSVQRQARASQLAEPHTREAMLQLLGDTHMKSHPVYMTGNVYEEGGPRLFTLCSVVFDLDLLDVTIYRGKPSNLSEILRLPLLMRHNKC